MAVGVGRRSLTSHGVAHDTAHTRESFSFHRLNVAALFGLFSSLYSYGVYMIARSDIPATPAHAAPCPPEARGRLSYVRGGRPSHRTVNAARFWCYTVSYHAASYYIIGNMHCLNYKNANAERARDSANNHPLIPLHINYSQLLPQLYESDLC